MKTETEVRRYLAALRARLAEPCDCCRVGGKVAARCRLSKLAVEVTICDLKWVLGEVGGEYADQVERMVFRAEETK